MLKWLEVESEAVKRVGWDAAGRELHIVYSGGRHYAYAPVPRRLFKELLAAESIGRFVNWRIKPCFTCREVTALGQRAAGHPDRRAHRQRQVGPGAEAGG
jgi:hypothetical protein